MSGILQPPTRQPRSYRDRQAAELCVYPGCPCGPADDSDLCPAHRDGKRERNRQYAARTYRARRSPGRGPKRCTVCGVPSKRTRCDAHRILDGRAAKRALDNSLDNAARTRTHADGRTRYHGKMKRGRQTNADLDAADLRDAIKALQRALDGLAHLQGPEVAALPTIQRDDALRAYCALVDQGRRFADEVLERRRYENMLAKAAPRPR